MKEEEGDDNDLADIHQLQVKRPSLSCEDGRDDDASAIFCWSNSFFF